MATPIPFEDTILKRSPYYTPSHERFRLHVREFTTKEILPFIDEWDESHTYPPEFHDKAYKAGVLSMWW